MPDWKFRAEYVKNCSCAFGCPCDFWAPPTLHKCEGMCAFNILSGHFDSTDLAGVRFVAVYHWPGPLHEGNGTFQSYVSANASEAQRTAMLTIASGKAGGPWFELLASVVSKIHKPRFLPIEFSFDLEQRRARVKIEGEMETVSEPIPNVATGDTHRIRIKMPKGMEYDEPEIANASLLWAKGPINFDYRKGVHSSLAVVEHTQSGLVRASA